MINSFSGMRGVVEDCGVIVVIIHWSPSSSHYLHFCDVLSMVAHGSSGCAAREEAKTVWLIQLGMNAMPDTFVALMKVAVDGDASEMENRDLETTTRLVG